MDAPAPQEVLRTRMRPQLVPESSKPHSRQNVARNPGASDARSPRILVLTAATGGGHDMRADALRRWTERLTNWKTRTYRPLEVGSPLYRCGVDTYNWIQSHMPVLHHLYFGFLEHAALHSSARRILGAGRFRSALEAFRPDVVVSTHGHLNHGYFELARRQLGKSTVRCVTYCGELGGGYGFSRHWVNPEADLFIGAVDATVDAAIALGMPENKAWLGGFLLRPSFYDDGVDSAQVRDFVERELNLDAGKFILLLATGAVGANNHRSILRQLEARGKGVQVVALCGRRASTHDALERWGARAKAVRLRCLRYREDMPLILRSVTAVVARPGTGTVSEAIQCGCPVILNGIGGIMPQESVTVRFALRHGIASSIRSAREIGELLDTWDRHPGELERIKRAMEHVRPSLGPRDIIEKATACPIPDNGAHREFA